MRPQTSYGRNHVAETFATIANSTHLHLGGPLVEVDHEPAIAVLDQEDLTAQGINTSTIIPGAPAVDALGSCTANATVAKLSSLLSQAAFFKFAGITSMEDTVGGEECAIRFYHGCSTMGGDPWPPEDGGSDGPTIVEYAKSLGLISGALIASGGQNIVSLMQQGSLLLGCPFLNAWEEPTPDGFVDGNGSSATLDSQLALGVAGGHETVLSAIEKLALTETGLVIPEQTVLRDRNSWTASWGDHGSFRIHLSSLLALGSQIDVRLLQP